MKIFCVYRDKLNVRHSIITYSDNLVRPVSWNGGRDGVDADGIPFYGSFEDEDPDTKVDNVVSLHDVVKKDKDYGNRGTHAA